MEPPELRDEEPPDDAVVVIRGGLHSLDRKKVIAVCEDSFSDFGFYGLSVFAALDRRHGGAVPLPGAISQPWDDLGGELWTVAVCRVHACRNRRVTALRRRASVARPDYR
jgi:hypothetical protein